MSKFPFFLAVVCLVAASAKGQFTTAREYKATALNTAFRKEVDTLRLLMGPVSDPAEKRYDVLLNVYLRDGKVAYLLWFHMDYKEDKTQQQLFSFQDGAPVEAAEVVTKKGTQPIGRAAGGVTFDVLLSQQEWDFRSEADSPRKQEMLDHAKFLLERYQRTRSQFKPDKP